MLNAFKTSCETYRQESQQTACHYDSMFLALIFTEVDALLANETLRLSANFHIYRLVLHVIILTHENTPRQTNDAHKISLSGFNTNLLLRFKTSCEPQQVVYFIKI